MVDIGELCPAAYNPRRMDAEMLDRLAEGIKEFGLVQPIVANRNGATVIGGHQRLRAAQIADIKQVPVVWLDLDDQKEKALNLALNKIEGDWDKDLLRHLLSEMDQDAAGLSGFATDEISELLADLAKDEFEPKCDQDEAPEPQEDVVSELGEIWHLGRHRIWCGDSTDVSGVMDLLGDEPAEMVFTDPPYLMDFQGAIGGDGKTNKTAQKHGKITNDKMSRKDGDQFLLDICATIDAACAGAWYVCFYRLGIDRLLASINAQGMRWRNLIIWHKQRFNLSNSDYKSTYEPIVVGWADDYQPILYGWNEHRWSGPKNERDCWEVDVPSLWEISRTKKNDLHPTMKPVDLVERAILNSSRAGQRVLDLFGGSGSTIIACEKSGRTAFVVELEPIYVDVMIRRWQNYTGEKAVRADGVTFQELEENA